MSGICGYIGFQDDELIKRMTRVIRHRGPDNVEYHVDEDITLGFTSISENANQSMFNEDKSVVLAFDGDIYNRERIKHDLEDKGHTFRSDSSSEVVLHAYEEYGAESLVQFNGMFAYALWNSRQKTLLLARDRLGLKQIYYSAYNGKFVFASEIKAILEAKDFTRELNNHALIDYITYANTIGNKTFFKNINILEPGHYLRYKDDQFKLKQYWDVEFNPNTDISVSEHLDKFREVVRQSVQRQLVSTDETGTSDVPLGCYLSGGFDSTTVTTIASELLDSPLPTFTGKFEEGGIYDESSCANAVADRIKSDHHLFTLTPQHFLDYIHDVIYHIDEPKVGPGSFSQYVVAKETAKEIKVVLTGHGGDEFFAGYPAYKSLFVKEVIKTHWLKLFNLGKYLNKSEFPFFVYFVLFSPWKPQVKYGLPILFHRKEWKKLFTPEYYSQIEDLDPNAGIEQILKDKQYDDVERVQYLTIKTYLPSLFAVEDKINMAHSLDYRAPICDNEMIELALSIPIEQKLHEHQLKYIIKEGMRDKLPSILYEDQRKKGFPTPISKWFRGPLKEFVRDTLLCEKAQKRGIFDPKYVSSILQKHFKSRFETPYSEVRSRKIWMLLNIELWFRIFMDNDKI